VSNALTTVSQLDPSVIVEYYRKSFGVAEGFNFVVNGRPASALEAFPDHTIEQRKAEITRIWKEVLGEG